MTDTMQTKERIILWDNLKGFLIFLVVFAHLFNDIQTIKTVNAVWNGIYMFHMPAFVFVSGYFGKSKHAQSEEAILKLFSAYVIINGLNGVIFSNYSIFTPWSPTWYILALIVWRLLTHILAKCKYIVPILAGLGLLAGLLSPN